MNSNRSDKTDGVEILIVEDSLTQAEQLKYMLERQGYCVSHAGNGKEAIVWLRAHKPTLIISDINMPEMDGYQLCRRIRLDEKLQDLPVILLTGLNDPEDVVRGLECGADNFITKPFEEGYLLARIRYILSNRHLHEHEKTRITLEVFFAGKKHLITADRLQILNLLLSTYETAVLKNHQLEKAKLELQNLNEELEKRVQERTVALRAENEERKRVEEALRLTHDKLRHLLEHSPGVIYLLKVEGERVIPYLVSENITRLLGFTVEESRRFDWWAAHLHPEDRDRALASIAETLEHGVMSMEYRIQRKDGRYAWVEDTRRVVRDANGKPLEIAGVWADITERVRTETALRESQERFRQLAESIREVFWMTDVRKNLMLYISPAFEAIWGRTCQSLCDEPQNWMEAIHPDDRERIKSAARTKQADGTYDEEYRITRPDGTVRWIRDRAFPVKNAAGEVYRVVGVAADITGERQLEEQFRHSQKMEAIGQLASGVAHDFNNILTVIQGYTELLRSRENLGGEAMEALNEVYIAAQRASNLTRQLLTFSRKQMMQIKALDLNVVLGDLAKMLKRIIGEDVTLQFTYAPNLPLIMADAGMLEQVVVNLAVNARDAMPQGGKLFIGTAPMAVGDAYVQQHPDAHTGDFVCLSVRDNGCGMTPEIMARMFEPFFTTKGAGKGTGLGLATVYGIVRQHRGWLEVASEVGVGTTFKAFFQASSQARAATETKKASEKARGGTETILLVEDETAVRELAGLILKQYGYRVLEAASGKEALAVWQEHAAEIALVITDMVMPDGLSGRDLSRQLLEHRTNLKMIYTSGYSTETLGGDLVIQEDVNFLQKPYRPQKLIQVVRHALDAK